MKKAPFLVTVFCDRWNVFAKVCTISIRRVCRSRRGRNHYVYGSWIKTVYTFVVQAIPEVIFNRHCLVEKISDNIDNLIEFGLWTLDLDTGRELNVHKTFRRRPRQFLNVLCTFNLRRVSIGVRSIQVTDNHSANVNTFLALIKITL